MKRKKEFGSGPALKNSPSRRKGYFFAEVISKGKEEFLDSARKGAKIVSVPSAGLQVERSPDLSI